MDSQEATQLFQEAQARYNDGQYNEAMQVLTRLNRSFPSAKNVLFPMAMCLEKLNHTGEAQQICDRLIAQFDDPRAREMKVRIENALLASLTPLPDVDGDLAGDLLGPAPKRKVAAAPKRGIPSWVWAVVGGVAVVLLLSLLVVLGGYAGQQSARGTPSSTIPAAAMLVAVLIGLGMYLFGCYCLKLICEKAGNDPGILIWIPLLQMIPLFTAADLSLVWFILLFVPFINIVATIMLWMKLSEARGKPSWLGILIIIPGFNLFLLLYLAFSE